MHICHVLRGLVFRALDIVLGELLGPPQILLVLL